MAMQDWHVILTQTGVESVWPDKQSATDWFYSLARLGRLPKDAVVASFDPNDEGHLMAATFSPQLNGA